MIGTRSGFLRGERSGERRGERSGEKRRGGMVAMRGRGSWGERVPLGHYLSLCASNCGGNFEVIALCARSLVESGRYSSPDDNSANSGVDK